MELKSRVGAALLGAILLGGATAGVSVASPDDAVDDHTVIINGIEYGPEDGLEVDTQQIELQPGEGPVGVFYGESGEDIMPLATWGSSYAISSEYLEIYYRGKAKAAGNVYDGKRIVKVCIWYTRGGEMKSDQKCSSAAQMGTGLWAPGAEVITTTWDSINPVAPKTIFQIQTTRINP